SDYVTHSANLLLGLVERARDGKFDHVKTVRLEQVARRPLVEQACDHDVGLEHQDVFGAARQRSVSTGIRLPGLETIARKTAETDNLGGIGQRQQKLIGAD